MTRDVAILGAGAFGRALAHALAEQKEGPRLTLWGRKLPDATSPYLPGLTLPENVTRSDDLNDITARTVLLALPAQKIGDFVAEHAARLDGRRLVSCAKGIDLNRLESPATLIAEACPKAIIAVLTGPSFAADIARGLPTALTLACADEESGAALQHQLSAPSLRLYRSVDVTGAQLGGALKNVMAIAAGAAIGAGFGDSARAAVITRGFAEMTRLATALGARPDTLTGLSGLGDLILTATSDLSRNFRFGKALGQGQPPEPGITVEGAATAAAVSRLAQQMQIDMPLADLVTALCDGRIDVQQALGLILARPLKAETSDI